MNRIGNLFKKDLILGIKDVFVLLEVGFAVVVLMLLLFLIPEDMRRDPAVYIYDESKVVENFVADNIGLENMEETTGEYYVDSREEIIEGMLEERSAIGLIITMNSTGAYNVELLTQPYTKPTLARYIEIDLEDLLALITPPYDFSFLPNAPSTSPYSSATVKDARTTTYVCRIFTWISFSISNPTSV